ncbi:MAG: YkgJ family cysteine cluster protein [Saprospiraceae bacterium]|nr:MAG: YkgJ family cysteine cluster protein [Saprospiraceae bacterium]
MAQSTLIQDWQRRKEKSNAGNKQIVKRLIRRKGKDLDALASEVHDRVFLKINCLDCANCCTSIPPIVTKADAARIARKFGMKPTQFERTYLLEDEDGDTVMNSSPCPFLLTNNECMIYDIRPKACRQFPHTSNLDFSKNMNLHAMNATVCPAVFHILRELDFGN